MAWTWLCLLIMCSVMYGSYGPLVRLSQVDGEVIYDSTQAVFVNELIKFVVSGVMLLYSGDDLSFSAADSLPYIMSGLCYFINNNLSFLIMSYLDPASFSILSNLKVLTTTLLYWLIMGKSLMRNQTLALLILFSASCLHSYGSVVDSSGPTTQSFKVTLPGVAMLLFGISLTSVASVSTEYYMKKRFKMSWFKQNIYLYSVGLLTNGVVAFKGLRYGDRYLFENFNIFTWIIILNTSLQGFGASYIMKYGSNITRLVLQSSSLLISTLLSVLVFHIPITIYVTVAVMLVVLALWIYNNNSGSRTGNKSKVN